VTYKNDSALRFVHDGSWQFAWMACVVPPGPPARQPHAWLKYTTRFAT